MLEWDWWVIAQEREKVNQFHAGENKETSF